MGPQQGSNYSIPVIGQRLIEFLRGEALQQSIVYSGQRVHSDSRCAKPSTRCHFIPTLRTLGLHLLALRSLQWAWQLPSPARRIPCGAPWAALPTLCAVRVLAALADGDSFEHETSFHELRLTSLS